MPLAPVCTGGTCCAPVRATLKDTGAACDGGVQAAMPARHPATMIFRREIEIFIVDSLESCVWAQRYNSPAPCRYNVHRWQGSDLSMFRRPHRRPRLCAWQSGNVALIWARTGGMGVLSHSIWPMGRTRFVPR